MTTRVTIKDIARELNVHHSTVSRALRGNARVKAETREKIVEYAEQRGYKINMSALHLRGSNRNVIAIMVPNINHQFFSNIISKITDLANDQGYVVSIFQTNESFTKEKNIINTLIQNNVAGVIASVSMQTTNGDHFNELIKYKIPLVFFDRVCDINVPKVVVNNQKIMEDAVNLLHSKSYKKIAHVSSSSTSNVFKDRQQGYKNAISSNHLDYKKIVKTENDFSLNEGKRIATELFKQDKKPDAIICDSYNLLLGIIAKLKEWKIKIPDAVGLIGFGENPSMEVISPNISAIVQPDSKVAHWAFTLLTNKITEQNSEKNENIVLTAKIIQRESC